MGRLDIKIEHANANAYERRHSFKRMATIDASFEPKKKEKKRSRSPPSRIPEDDDLAIDMCKDHDLYLAARRGDVDECKRILGRVSTPTLSTGDVLSRLSPIGNTFLHIAADMGHEDIVSLIATVRPSLMLAKNFNGETALHLAAKRWNGITVLLALLQIHHNWLQSLPQNHEDANDLLRAKNDRGYTALHELLLSGQGATAEYLIRQDPELSYIRNNKSQSALYLAVRSGNVGCVSLMLQLCSDEERVNQLFHNKSPIEAAIIRCFRSDFNTSPRLIKVRDCQGRNPLHFAASLGHLFI